MDFVRKQFSDDPNNHPTFHVLEDETRLALSDLSIKRKPKSRWADENEGIDSAVAETVVPELDEQSQKDYETVHQIIEAGQVEKLKVDECKIYLRKHGLRLSGKKEILIQRIKEHIDIVSGGGEKKYPASSFSVNCKGDACMGDVVMFEQNVYETFNIASRSATGPPCGTRIVAGRIVKESYGSAKQQHTFTIEVLWSKGEKPLPPLHPLLIKGRNLYKLKTMRQRWDDEGERWKMLSEKHYRGRAARENREARIQRRETQKTHKRTRVAAINEQENRKQEGERRDTMHRASIKPKKLVDQPKLQQQDSRETHKQQNPNQMTLNYPSTCINIPNQPKDLLERSYGVSQVQVQPERLPQRQPLISINHHAGGKDSNLGFKNFYSWRSSTQEGQGSVVDHHMSNEQHGFASDKNLGYSQRNHYPYHTQPLNMARNVPAQKQGYKSKQTCRLYAQGRCYYGDKCKYLHE